MSKRLASFHGPSTPTASPVKHQQSAPSSPGRPVESTYHRKLRSLLQDLRTICCNWEELVKVDGLKTVTLLTDTRTQLDNDLRSLPTGTDPVSPLVGPKIEIMEKCLGDLDNIVTKLRKQYTKMNMTMDNLEEVLFEAHKMKGWTWVHEEPLWCTWPLEKFVNEIPDLLRPYGRSLQHQMDVAESLRSHSLTFEESRGLVSSWAAQPHLESDDWASIWEDLCEVEVERWNTS